MSHSSAAKPDQRANRRFSLRLPVSIRYTDGRPEEIPAETTNVSAHGVFFNVQSRLAEGSRIEFTMTLPPEVTMTDAIRVRCRGKVVRVDSGGSGQEIGVAVLIEQYDFIADPVGLDKLGIKK
ncbi:MAG TPA: PilZ domain-containing protein [Terriglobales bacterium]